MQAEIAKALKVLDSLATETSSFQGGSQSVQQILRSVNSELCKSLEQGLPVRDGLHRIFEKIVLISPLLDDAILVVVLILLKFKDLSSFNDIDSIEMSLVGNQQLDAECRLWVRLGICRVLSSGNSMSEILGRKVYDEAQQLLESELRSSKGNIFKARCVELFTMLLRFCNESFLANRIAAYLFVDDDLLLYKTREFLLAFMEKYSGTEQGDALFSSLVEIDASKAKFQVLADLVSRIRSAKCFPERVALETRDAIANDRSIGPAAADFLASIMARFPESNFDDMSFQQLLDFFFISPNTGNYVLPRIARTCPGWLETVKDWVSEKATTGNRDEYMKMFVHLCIISIDYGIKFAFDVSLIHDGLYHHDAFIRTGCFAFLCKSHAVSIAVCPETLKRISTFVEDMLLGTSLENRQKALAAMKHLLSTLLARLYLLIREKDLSQSDEIECIRQFLANTLESTSLSIYAHCGYSRLDFSLKYLLLFAEMYQKRSSSPTLAETGLQKILDVIVKKVFCSNDFKTRLLFCCLDNTFDSELACSLLKFVWSFGQDSISNGVILNDDIMLRLTCPRECSQDGAARLIQAMFDESRSHIPGGLVASLLSLLKSQLALIETNIVQAATKNSIIGTILALRRIVASKMFALNTELDTLISLFRRACVLAIVPASLPAPEGADITDEMCSSQDQTAAHAVMTFCWRVIKEACLAISTAVTKQHPSAAAMLDIIDFMVDLLFSLRHPGAFTAIGEPLQNLCQYCLASGDPALQDLPLLTLQKSLKECLLHPEVQTTRRSAGLPICISSIVCSSKDDVARGKLLKVPMHAMIDVLKGIDLASLTPNPSVIHALNILRIIFREASLARDTIRFVSQGYAVCFQCFASASWAVRNCSMMLFGSLTSRTFGSKSERDDFAELNQTDIRNLADRVPELFSLLQKEFIRVSSLNSLDCLGSLDFAVYPLLSTLQRMRFSNGSVAAHEPFVNQAISFLKWALSNRIKKVRNMAARILATISVQSTIAMEMVFRQVLLRISGSANKVDGHLYMLELMLKSESLTTRGRLEEYVKTMGLDKSWCDSSKSSIERLYSLKYVEILGGCLEAGLETCLEVWLVLDDKDVIRVHFAKRLFHHILCKLWMRQDCDEMMMHFMDKLALANQRLFLDTVLVAANDCYNSTTLVAGVSGGLRVEKLALDVINEKADDLILVQNALKLLNWAGHLIDSRELHAVACKMTKRYPLNEEILGQTLALMASSISADADSFLDLIDSYACEEKTDMVRLHAANAFKKYLSVPREPSFRLFLLLRKLVVDDDEDVRETALQCAKYFASSGGHSSVTCLSTAATLREIHRFARSRWSREYQEWILQIRHISRERTRLSAPVFDGVLFLRERLNLFEDLEWELEYCER